MKLLPVRTEPFESPLARRHMPPRTHDYRTFRRCLRWDFGFTCVFCLTHEADFARGGAEGLGIMTVEHVVPKNARAGQPELEGEYANCVLACRLCNTARGSRRNRDVAGRRLLDPTRVAWGKHFTVLDDELHVKDPTDPDASYTHAAYDLADPRKTELRRVRRTVIGTRLRLVSDVPKRLEALLKAAEAAADPVLARRLLEFSRQLVIWYQLALDDLRHFGAVPRDAPLACACPEASQLDLPQQIASQTVSLG